MNSIVIPTDLLLYLGVFASLLAFGVGYNALTAWLERKHYTEGFLSLLVVGGVFVTLVGVAILNWSAALLTLAGFAASGTPMIIGSLHRYLVARKHLRQEISHEPPKAS